MEQPTTRRSKPKPMSDNPFGSLTADYAAIVRWEGEGGRVLSEDEMPASGPSDGLPRSAAEGRRTSATPH